MAYFGSSTGLSRVGDTVLHWTLGCPLALQVYGGVYLAIRGGNIDLTYYI